MIVEGCCDQIDEEEDTIKQIGPNMVLTLV